MADLDKLIQLNKQKNILSENENRLIYVYDFLNLWTFFVELMETAEKDHLKGYPSLIFSHGEVPETPPDKDFIAEEGFEESINRASNSLRLIPIFSAK